MFNFFGVLNFKLKKYNKSHLREAFEAIKDKSKDKYFHLLLKSTAMFLSKDNLILQLVKASIEVNRRNNIRNQTVFKMSRFLNLELKNVLRILTLNAKQRQPKSYRRDPGYYSGWDLTYLI